MKKKISVFCAAVLAVLLTACSGTNTTVSPSSLSLEEIPSPAGDVKVAEVSGDMLYNPQTVEELDDLSDCIVRGTLLDDARQKLYSTTPGVVTFGVTVSSFEVSKVYKGDLKAGDVIPIAERYYTVEEDGEAVRYEHGYAPSTPNKEYIFFLIKDPEDHEFLGGFYSPMVKETGRYPVIDKKGRKLSEIETMTAEDLNIIYTKLSTYKNLYKEVIELYM